MVTDSLVVNSVLCLACLMVVIYAITFSSWAGSKWPTPVSGYIIFSVQISSLRIFGIFDMCSSVSRKRVGV